MINGLLQNLEYGHVIWALFHFLGILGTLEGTYIGRIVGIQGSMG